MDSPPAPAGKRENGSTVYASHAAGSSNDKVGRSCRPLSTADWTKSCALSPVRDSIAEKP
jgi:hypothetical protein